MDKITAGIVISLVLFITSIFINIKLYMGVMPTTFIIAVLLLHIVAFPSLIKGRRFFTYGVFFICIIATIILSMPNYTKYEALALASTKYDLQSPKIETIQSRHSILLFKPSRMYYVTGTSSYGNHYEILVDPVNGTMFEELKKEEMP